MKKIIVFFVLAAFFSPCFVFADGGMVHFDPYSDRWDYADETNQQAFINYENGTEKMILSIGTGDSKEGKTMWIFPVPADPNKVALNVVTKLPSLRGEEISEKAQSNLDGALTYLQATQIYMLPYVFLRGSMLSASSSFDNSMPASTSLGGSTKSVLQPDVVIYDHLEKEGITSEIVTARTAQGFDDYFKNKGLNINESSIPVLQKYIGKAYSFVVSWMDQQDLVLTDGEISNLIINGNDPCEYAGYNCSKDLSKLISDLKNKYPDFGNNKQSSSPFGETKFILSNDELKDLTQGIKENPSLLSLAGRQNEEVRRQNEQKGVFVSFPTDKIFFPLMPTSVYGSKIVPAEIRIMGYVTPDVFSDIKSYTKIGYYYDEGIQIDSELKSFYNGPNTGVKYTKVEINAPSKLFTDDLWAKNSVPLKTYYQLFLANQVFLVVLFLLALCSVLTGLFTGWLHFREWRNWEGMKKFALIGLANCLTMLGMIAVILPTKTIKDSEDAISLIQTIKEKGYYWKRRMALGIIIVDFPFLIISLFVLFFALSQILSLVNRSIFEIFFPLLLLPFVPIIIFLVAFLFAESTKKEDKYLFEKLKQKNYSSWTFQPKDKRKIGFIFLYSLFFLIISWIIVKLLMLSVGGQIINLGNPGIQF